MAIGSFPDLLDRRFLIDTPVQLAQVPADMTVGQEAFVELHDSKLIHRVQKFSRSGQGHGWVDGERLLDAGAGAGAINDHERGRHP